MPAALIPVVTPEIVKESAVNPPTTPTLLLISTEPLKVETPAVTSIPPAVTLTPVLAVISPIESTLVLSSTVKVPPMVTLPLNSAVAATIFPVKVDTPVTINSSKLVSPSTSRPPVLTSSCGKVETPVTSKVLLIVAG